MRVGLAAATAVVAATVVAVAPGLSKTQTVARRSNPNARSVRRWSIQRTPNPAGADFSRLNAVSCTGRRRCIAVGRTGSQRTFSATLAERWNGAKWRLMGTPSPGSGDDQLDGVSCARANACMAVGDSLGPQAVSSLVERWNGQRWSVQATPSAAAQLLSVSCTAVNACTAVGGYTDPDADPGALLAERWNGKRWRIQATSLTGLPGRPFAGALLGVSCAGPLACTAVGFYLDSSGFADQWPLVGHWNGRRWTFQRAQVPKGCLNGPNGCLPPEVSLTGVSCPHPRSCVAVGNYVVHDFEQLIFAERWNGRRWRIEPTPIPRGELIQPENGLLGVSCTPSDACTAVGYYPYNGSPYLADEPLAEQRRRTRWSFQEPPQARTDANSELYGVSCRRGTCIAVGSWDNSAGNTMTLAERY